MATKKYKTDFQNISDNAGRPMLNWVGKRPLEAIEYFPSQEKEAYGNKNAKEFNKLFWGDNLQVLSHLLKDYREKIDLIYIDPPFDSKADYVKKIKLKGMKLEGTQQSLLEEKQYTDIWENDEYLQFMYERLQILRELLTETGSIYLHCDWHKNSYLRLIMDEVFGADNFVNEIIWCYTGVTPSPKNFKRKHDVILLYSKSKNYTFNPQYIPYKKLNATKKLSHGSKKLSTKEDRELLLRRGKEVEDWWIDLYTVDRARSESYSYPTQKPEALLERIINASSNPGDLVLDCFVGSGTTCAVAQKLDRRWIGCDINYGAIQTTTKRLIDVIDSQKDSKQNLLDDNKSLDSFKVFMVNNYDIFKNEVESKSIVMDLFGIDSITGSFFDGMLENQFVKVLPLNRILNKLDIDEIIKNVNLELDNFTVKTSSGKSQSTYEESVLIICSGYEYDIDNYIETINDTGASINFTDIQSEKESLVFKKPTEAIIDVSNISKNNYNLTIKDFFSPLVQKKLELSNKSAMEETLVDDYRQIIESVSIDIEYDKIILAPTIIDTPSKKEVIKGAYSFETKNELIAIKIVDILGEEYFQSINLGELT